jgi:hypothetical protein
MAESNPHGISLIVDAETMAGLHKLAESQTDDLVELMSSVKITPKEVEQFIPNLFPSEQALLIQELSTYRRSVEALVDAAIADKPYLDRQQQIDTFWNSPFLPETELVYHG